MREYVRSDDKKFANFLRGLGAKVSDVTLVRKKIEPVVSKLYL
jgi:hypothetical protein